VNASGIAGACNTNIGNIGGGDIVEFVSYD